MSKRKQISARMKVDTLLAQVFRQFGKHLLCPLSQIEMLPGDDIEFDHIHCVELDGPHAYQNLRAVHIGAHKKKTKADLRMIKKTRPGHTETFVVNKRPTERKPLCEGGPSPCDCGGAEIGDAIVDCDRITPKPKPRIRSRGFQEKPAGYKHNWSWQR